MVLLTAEIITKMNRIRLLAWVGAFEFAMDLLQEIRGKIKSLQREYGLYPDDHESGRLSRSRDSQLAKFHDEIAAWERRIQFFMTQLPRRNVEKVGYSIVSIFRRQSLLYEVRGIVDEKLWRLKWPSGNDEIDVSVAIAERLFAHPRQEIAVRILPKEDDGLVGGISFFGLGVFRGNFLRMSRLEDVVWLWLRKEDVNAERDSTSHDIDDTHRRFIHRAVEGLVGAVYHAE